MDDARTPTTTGTELLDTLEQVLVAQFGLRSAVEHAHALLADETLERARARVDQARGERSDAIARGATLEAIGAAGAREQAAEQIVAQIQAWRGREQSREQLAVEVFCGARGLGMAADPRWRPGLELLGPGEPAPLYLRAPKLRIAGHFEPDVDLLIHDGSLGTLAMIQVLEPGTAEAIREQVSRYVDRATYLRHLLLTARDEHGSEDRQIVSIELVLVHRAEPPAEHSAGAEDRGDLLYEVGQILRDLALETNCLHAIGINVLTADLRGFSRAGLRRAFAWLLHDARRWFAELERGRVEARGPGPSAAQFGRLRAIELDEYRLPGQRTLELDADTRLHLLHGHNGSGKSSLVEALELMLTGSIERLSGIEDYEHVLRNRWAETPAQIALHGSEPGAAPLRFQLDGASRPPVPLAPGSRAASFRLDQTVMDRLARASDIDRAAELLAAFFADEAEIRERWQAAVAAAEATLARLPKRVTAWLEGSRGERQDLHEVVVEQLAELANHRLGPALFDALLPLPRADLRPLHAQLPALAELDQRLEREGYIGVDDRLIEGLEAGFAALASELDARVATVEAVLRTLDRVGRWWQEGEVEGFTSEADYAAALDEWLELSALVELAEQQQRVLAILQGARGDGWDDRRLGEAGSAGALLRQLAGAPPSLREDLERACEQWAAGRDRLARALRTSGAGEAATKPVASTRVRLANHEVTELDRFGRWWAPSESGLGLGQRIRAAIEGGEARSFAGADIGAQAWVTPIHEGATRMLAPLQRLRQAWRATKRELLVEAPAPELEEAAVKEAEAEEAEEAAAQEVDAIELEIDRFAPTRSSASSRLQAQLLAPQPAAARPKSASGSSVSRGPVSVPLSRSIPLSIPALDGGSAPPPSSAPVPRRRPAAAPSPAVPAIPTPAIPTLEIGLAGIVDRLRQVYAVSLAASQVGAKVHESFVARLAARDERALGLVDALNELMALFTPARWAYEDIVLRYEEDGEVSRLQFETGDIREPDGHSGPPIRARADLRLNTAQLNAFTLALFLLCAPRVNNPIGLLVLDDPLQNMDELTVTTLARGLAKLLRVMPKRWSLMMLFHGEGDLARFHDEVECGVYFLPWLSPTIRGQAIDIGCRREDSRLGLTIQAIEELVALRP